MRCFQAKRILLRYQRGGLEELQAEKLCMHLACCKRCRARLAEIEKLSNLLADSSMALPALEPNPSLLDRLESQIQRDGLLPQAKSPWWLNTARLRMAALAACAAMLLVVFAAQIAPFKTNQPVLQDISRSTDDRRYVAEKLESRNQTKNLSVTPSTESEKTALAPALPDESKMLKPPTGTASEPESGDNRQRIAGSQPPRLSYRRIQPAPAPSAPPAWNDNNGDARNRKSLNSGIVHRKPVASGVTPGSESIHPLNRDYIPNGADAPSAPTARHRLGVADDKTAGSGNWSMLTHTDPASGELRDEGNNYQPEFPTGYRNAVQNQNPGGSQRSLPRGMMGAADAPAAKATVSASAPSTDGRIHLKDTSKSLESTAKNKPADRTPGMATTVSSVNNRDASVESIINLRLLSAEQQGDSTTRLSFTVENTGSKDVQLPVVWKVSAVPLGETGSKSVSDIPTPGTITVMNRGSEYYATLKTPGSNEDTAPAPIRLTPGKSWQGVVDIKELSLKPGEYKFTFEASDTSGKQPVRFEPVTVRIK